MDVVAMVCAHCKTASIVANARPVGPVEIAVYVLKWNVKITWTMIKVRALRIIWYNYLLNHRALMTYYYFR